MKTLFLIGLFQSSANFGLYEFKTKFHYTYIIMINMQLRVLFICKVVILSMCDKIVNTT